MSGSDLTREARIELTGYLLSRIADLAGQHCGDCRNIKQLALRAHEVLGRPVYDPAHLVSPARKQEDEAIQRLFDEIRIEANSKASAHDS